MKHVHIVTLTYTDRSQGQYAFEDRPQALKFVKAVVELAIGSGRLHKVQIEDPIPVCDSVKDAKRDVKIDLSMVDMG